MYVCVLIHIYTHTYICGFLTSIEGLRFQHKENMMIAIHSLYSNQN